VYIGRSRRQRGVKQDFGAVKRLCGFNNSGMSARLLCCYHFILRYFCCGHPGVWGLVKLPCKIGVGWRWLSIDPVRVPGQPQNSRGIVLTHNLTRSRQCCLRDKECPDLSSGLEWRMRPVDSLKRMTGKAIRRSRYFVGFSASVID
jgi:hypothetical protein